ncbi:MAG: hypothetical protein KBC84_01245 [Proteobacteria bacterium]|nr:hypothetical protein [Pseudomonadota bacterium]
MTKPADCCTFDELEQLAQKKAVLKCFAEFLIKEKALPTFLSWQKLQNQNQEQVGKQVNE